MKLFSFSPTETLSNTSPTRHKTLTSHLNSRRLLSWGIKHDKILEGVVENVV